MRSYEERLSVVKLIADGLNDCEIARRTGIPRATVRDWRRGRGRPIEALASDTCPACGGSPGDLPAGRYAYLLGQYLGDGHISRGARDVYRLRISCCREYAHVIREVEGAIRAVRPANRVGRVDHPRDRVVVVYAYSKHWPCLFPQHGPGVKHERLIALSDWQKTIVDRHPRMLLRGLIHSDGWRGTNRVTARGRNYAYPRYQFSNVSDDIRRIFCDACDAVGVEWRRMNATNVSVARRRSVALLDEFIGPKR